MTETKNISNMEINKEEGYALISINPKIYPLDVVYSAVYILLDKAYIVIDGDPEEEIIVEIRSKEKNGKVRVWSLAATKNYRDPCSAVRDYRLRWQIEERYRQIKSTWLDKGFKSTSFNLVSAHIIFTLLVYSLIQIYLNMSKLNSLANKTMESLCVILHQH